MRPFKFCPASLAIYLNDCEVEEKSLDTVIVQRYTSYISLAQIMQTVKDGGTLLLMEKLRRSASHELFSYACNQEANPTLEDWIELLEEEKPAFSYELINETTVIFKVKPSEKV